MPYLATAGEAIAVADFDERGSDMEYAGFWRRVAAYLIDYIPILIIVTSIWYGSPSLEHICQEFQDHPDDASARARFLAMRSVIKVLPFLVWLILCTILEPTRLHGSFGKFLLHLKVLDEKHQKITLKQAFVRNTAKIASSLTLGLGYLWVACTERKQGWHDILADTVVVWDPYDDDDLKKG